MKYLEVEIPHKTGYLIPIGDLHVGDPAFEGDGRKKLQGYLDWVMEREGARIFLLGDIYNVAGRDTATPPFDTNTNEYELATEIFRPYADRIIGAVEGNHEARMIDKFGTSPLQWFCRDLDIPYCGWSAVVRFKVGKRSKDVRFFQNYFGFFHHTTGGGATVGGKLNRVAKLRDIVEGMDMYCGGHNHQLAAAPVDVYYPSIQGRKMLKRRIWYVDCGSYLSWEGSYAEQKMMAPTKLGSPRIRLDGSQHNHDVHVNI